MITGVDGEEGKTRRQAAIDVGRGLEVIGVRADAFAPAFLEDSPRGIVHHVIRGAAGAGHFADRLLCKNHGAAGRGPGAGDRSTLCDCPGSAHVPRRCQSQPVAAAGRGAQTQQPRLQPGQRCTQRCGIGVGQRAEKEGSIAAITSRSRETGEDGTLRCGDDHTYLFLCATGPCHEEDRPGFGHNGVGIDIQTGHAGNGLGCVWKHRSLPQRTLLVLGAAVSARSPDHSIARVGSQQKAFIPEHLDCRDRTVHAILSP